MRPRTLTGLLCVIAWCGAALGEDGTPDMERALDGLRTMPVQYEGRVMPLEVMCRGALQELTGLSDPSGYAPKECASHDAVFTYVSIAAEPERWKEAALFEIGYRPLRKLFGAEGPGRISFAQAATLKSMTELRSAMETDPRLMVALQDLLIHLQEFPAMERHLAIFPTGEGEPWLEPGQLERFGGSEGKRAAEALRGLVQAFRLRDAKQTRSAVEELRGVIREAGGKEQLSEARVRLEYAFSRLSPLTVVAWAYVAPLVLAIAALASGRRSLRRAALAALTTVFVLHSLALAGRSIIAGRLPLANTYEYAVMTAWATVLLAILFESHFKGGVFVLLGSLLGSASLAAASVAPISRDVAPLMPALRSTWLQYHVLTVFIGYAAFLLAFGVSGYYLLKGRRGDETRSDGLLRANQMLIRIGFLFLTLGIMTGCIWANLSWGRYWGWDPKEVWALITWLVYVTYLHMEAAGWKERWLGPAASCVGFGFVMFTYLGVNYLLSGLHSYAS